MNKKILGKGKYIVFAIIMVLVIGLGSYIYLARADDLDENKLTVKNIKVSSIEDGTAPFDENNDAGNDSSNLNGIVRTFDEVKFTVNYDLVAKQIFDGDNNPVLDGNNNPTYENVSLDDPRTILIDVLVPSNVSGYITTDHFNYNELIPVFNGAYKYYEFSMNVLPSTNNVLDIYLSDVYASNGYSFSPLVIIKESSDTSTKVISELTDEEKNASYDTVSSSFNKSSCLNSYGGELSCLVLVSGVENYTTKVFLGRQSSEGLVTNIPVGFLVGLEDRNTASNENKGIKGLIYPTSVSFNVSSSTNVANTVTYADNSITNYKDSLDYKVFLDENNSVELPVARINDTYIGTMSGNVSDNVLNVSSSNIYFTSKNNVVSLGDKNIHYLTTGSFVLTSTRNSYTENKYDIPITITASNNSGLNETLETIDRLNKYIGTYESKISIYDSNSSTAMTDGEAIINYGQKFDIENTFAYGRSSGDGLESLTNYTKIDNEAIKLLLDDNNNDFELVYTNDNQDYNVDEYKPNVEVFFGYGRWNSDYFSLADNAPSSCPNISFLIKNEFMNLYGGPCIKENSNVKWVSHIDSSELTDEEKAYGPMIVKVVLTKADGKDYVYPATIEKLKMKAKIKDDYNLALTSHQIVSNATAMFNDSVSTKLYYLSNVINKSAVSEMSNMNNYIITDYDYENRSIITPSSNLCNNSTCYISGNTILVSGVRVSKPTVTSLYEDRETSNFYYYPIEWRITGNAYSNDIDVIFKQANLKVYVPSYLKIDNYNTNNIEPLEINDVVINEVYYKELKYVLNIDNEGIVNIAGQSSIKPLSIFTNIYLDTRDNSTPEVFAELDYEVEKIDDSVIKEFKAVSSNLSRTGSKSVVIHNNYDVTTYGSISPAFIEKNGTYRYNVKAYNNSWAIHTSGYNYENAALYYVLPYKNDSSYDESSSSFTSTGYKIKLDSVPAGYKVYYTNGTPSEIIPSEINTTSASTYEWIEWTNPKAEITTATAIKIAKDTAFTVDTYFGGGEGFYINVTPINSGVGDIYYNSFYLIADRPSNFECIETDSNSCDNIRNTKSYYASTKSVTSVYNRHVSGFVFEDYDGNGFYDEGETKIENIPVSICKVSKDISTSEYNETDPTTYVSDQDECIADTITDIDGRFTMRGLTEGNYYVKYIFDNEKYSVTEANKTVVSNEVQYAQYNSKSYQIPNTNIAVSNVLTYTKASTGMSNINLGLKIRKQFSVNINKFITKAEVTSNNDTKVYEYDNASKVTLNLRNPKNAHIRVTYGFVVENVKYYPGYVNIIIDKMPKGMTFDPNIEVNKEWVQSGNSIYYQGLSGKLLIPGEKHYFQLVLDLDVTEGGNYVNIAAAKDLILMGDEIPEVIIDNNEESNNQ